MRKILFVLLFTIVAIKALAQPYITIYNYGNAFQRLSVFSSLIIPYKDTGALLTDSVRAGGLTIRPADNKLYLFNGAYWDAVSCCTKNAAGTGIIISNDTIKVDTTVIGDKNAANTWTGVQTFSVPIIFSSSTTAGGTLYTTSVGVVTSTTAGSGVSVLHGGVVPSFSQVSLSADVTGNLPVANLNSGTNASASSVWAGNATWKTITSLTTQTLTATGNTTVAIPAQQRLWSITFLPASGSESIKIGTTNGASDVMPNTVFSSTLNAVSSVGFSGRMFSDATSTTLFINGAIGAVTYYISYY